MTAEEHAEFWTEISVVANALASVYAPIHLNFQILGNQDPHVHVHVVPRYNPDPAPSLPLPAVVWQNSHVLSADEMARQIAMLQNAVAER
jgi:diadenosine tetraphosphate (Ap4A) HIT family hydrolase